MRWGKEEKFIDMMLALHHAADRKRASHLPNTPEAPWLPTIPLMPLGMHQGKASPELGPKKYPLR